MVKCCARSEVRGVATNLKQTLAVRVRLYRQKAGLTQEELGERVGRTAETISNIERGRTLPTLQTLGLVAEVLETPIRDFFEIPGTEENADPVRVELAARLQITALALPTNLLKVAVEQVEALEQSAR